MRIILTDRAKVILCWSALILSALFLIIGVDYLPCLICWIPLCIVGYAVYQCEPFRVKINKIVDEL